MVQAMVLSSFLVASAAFVYGVAHLRRTLGRESLDEVPLTPLPPIPSLSTPTIAPPVPATAPSQPALPAPAAATAQPTPTLPTPVLPTPAVPAPALSAAPMPEPANSAPAPVARSGKNSGFSRFAPRAGRTAPSQRR